MSENTHLESYLAALDKALGPISVGDRSEIITEIKSHIMDARERSPEQSLGSILSSIGEPETVANRYLLERGLKPGRPSRSPMIKWLTIGFLGTIGILCLTLILLVWKFTPLISVDDTNQRITLLGGAIDIDGGTETIKMGTLFLTDDLDYQYIKGEYALAAKTVTGLQLDFNNGKVEIEAAKDNVLSWECKIVGDQKPEFGVQGRSYLMNFNKNKGIQCELKVPPQLEQTIQATNAKIEIEKPQSKLDVTVTNGQVRIEPDSQRVYRYDMQVKNGSIRGFKNSSDAPSAIPIKVSLANGRVTSKD